MPNKPDKSPDATLTGAADPAAAYGQALDHLDTIRRQPGCDDPVSEDSEIDVGEDYTDVFSRLRPSPLLAAERAVDATRRALHAAQGPAAVQLADAKARHRAAVAAVARAEQFSASGVARKDLATLAAEQDATARHVQIMEGVAARQRAAYEQRTSLDTTHAAELEQATAKLEQARKALAEAAGDAEVILFALVNLADEYACAHHQVTAHLVELGFTSEPRFDGTSHTTTPAPTLRINGQPWTLPAAAELLARAVARVADATGERQLRDGMRRYAGHRPYEADALLADVPEPVRVARKIPQPAQAVRADVGHPEPVLADKSSYLKTPKMRIRRRAR